MRIVAVVLNWNQTELTEAAVEAILPQVDDVIVVDNFSELEDRGRLEVFARTRGLEHLQTGSNLGYAGGCNRGIQAALAHAPDAVLVMNNDAFVDPGGVDLLAAALEDDARVAAVGPAVFEYGRPDTALHVACAYRSRWAQAKWVGRGLRREEIGGPPIATEYLSGEVVLMRTVALRELGAFDERFVSYLEDVEWSLRARRAGWLLKVVQDAAARHMVGASGASDRGEYLRSRNRGLIIRVTEGDRRLRILARTLPHCALVISSHIRRRRWELALRGTLCGWWVGSRASIAGPNA